MEKEKPLYFALKGQRHHVVHAAVSPADMLFVFRGVVLRVYDQDIRSAQKSDHLLLFLPLIFRLVRLVVRGDRLDVLIAATAATWIVWSAYLGLRLLGGWSGRRAAYLALTGFVLVVIVRLALPATHFA